MKNRYNEISLGGRPRAVMTDSTQKPIARGLMRPSPVAGEFMPAKTLPVRAGKPITFDVRIQTAVARSEYIVIPVAF